jgi:tungstate transport system substrate-binding protein
VTRRLAGAALLATVALAGLAPPARAASKVVILTTTSSVQDSGLLDVLVPLFERRTGFTVKTIAVGTGQALALAARGEADVTLAHAPALEQTYVEDGTMLRRQPVMANDFVIVGPADDPAWIKGSPRAGAAFTKIAAARARFVSRGDGSGTHALESSLWKQAGVTPGAPWYIESGQGMGATLGLAHDRQAYTLTDRATLLAFRRRVDLAVMVEGDPSLVNVYSVLPVNPARGSRVNAAGGQAFADFMVSPEAQAVITTYGADTYGQPLFIPIGGTRGEGR